MAFITLSGTLLDPNGDLAVGDQIRFTHKSTTGETVESAVSLITVNPAGTYSLPLQYGLVLVEYKDVRTQQFKNLGVATVNSDNPATSIPELLNALVPVSSAELIEFQAILADCVTAQTAAEAAQAAAENAATTAEAFAYQLTTTDLIAGTATFAAATNIPTSGFTVSGDSGDGSWKQNGVTGQTPSQSPTQLGGALLNDGNGNQWALIAGKAINLESVGFISGDATAFLSALAGNVKRVTTNQNTISTSSTVDMLSTEIEGLDGRLTITGSGVKNCLLVGAFKRTKPDFVSVQSPSVPSASQDIKMLIRRFGQAAYIMQANNQGYIRTVIQDGVFTSVDSAGSPAELIRSTRVDAFNEIWVGHGVADLVNGVAATIETFNGGVYQRLSSAGQTATSSFDKGAGLSKYFITTNGDYVEYQNLEVVDGFINLMIQTSSSTTFANGFTVDIDGVAITLPDSVNNSPSGDAGLLVYKIPVEFSELSGSSCRTLRVTHVGVTATDKVNIIGCNMYRLNELAKPLSNTNWFAAFALDVEYVSNNGASDYAIFDTDDNQWIGSFHGGETRSSYRTEIDGASFDYSLAAFEDVVMGKQIRMQQSTNINGKMQSYQYIDFSHFGGYSLQVSMTGDVNCSEFFTCMSTSDPRFEFLEFPKAQSTAVDGKYDVGNNDNVVIQYAPVAADGFDRRKIRNSFTFFNSGDTDYNGAYVQRAGSLYNKLYYGPVFVGQANIKEIAFMVIKEFY
jgi:hypothetical protein